MYLRDGPACRRCHHLDWLCRHACRQTPGLFRVARWRRQIRADPHPFSALPEFPPQRIRIEESKLVDHLGSIVHDLDGRIRVRRAKADVMNQKRRDLILRRAERAIADENKCTLTARGFKT
jgi:hypothetical protein